MFVRVLDVGGKKEPEPVKLTGNEAEPELEPADVEAGPTAPKMTFLFCDDDAHWKLARSSVHLESQHISEAIERFKENESESDFWQFEQLRRCSQHFNTRAPWDSFCCSIGGLPAAKAEFVNGKGSPPPTPGIFVCAEDRRGSNGPKSGEKLAEPVAKENVVVLITEPGRIGITYRHLACGRIVISNIVKDTPAAAINARELTLHPGMVLHGVSKTSTGMDVYVGSMDFHDAMHRIKKYGRPIFLHFSEVR